MIFKNILKPTIRHLLRYKAYLLVNVLSLTIGLLCCLYVFQYVQTELSYDRFHEDADRIYRIEYDSDFGDGAPIRYANLHGSFLYNWLSDIPEIDLITRFAPYSEIFVETGGEQFAEGSVFAADSSFFNLFTFEFIVGDPDQALNIPNSVVISTTTAVKYFNDIDVTGETLLIRFRDQEVLLVITGVIKDVPNNSHFSFDIVTSDDAFEQLYEFDINDIQTGYNYIKSIPEVTGEQLEASMQNMQLQNEVEYPVYFHLQPLTDIHLYSDARGELEPNSSITYLYILTLIAFIILVIACINFASLATAKSVVRTNEIGIRKVYGAHRRNLISSFLLEGILVALSALIFAWLLAHELLPQFNQLANTSITTNHLSTPSFVLIMFLLAALTGVISGIYPAFILTRYKPTSLFSDHSSHTLKAGSFWKGVVITQFASVTVLISASFIIHQQVQLIQNKDMGFEKDQIITIPNYVEGDPSPFMDRLRQHSNIDYVTVSSYIPGVSKTSGTASVRTEDHPEEMTFNWISVDPHYLDTYGITLAQGRNFSEDFSTDTTAAFLINETAARVLGWDEPIGNSIEPLGIGSGQVIGVVEDFNMLSLHHEIAPLLIYISSQYHWTISSKIISTGQLQETLTFIEREWQNFIPGAPFSYNFVDSQFEAVYESELKTQSLFFLASGLAVAIAILGLFSFASFLMRQKRYEISIRKVLGASVYDILKHFYTGYFKLLAISSVIALPVVLIWMGRWLQNFSYRIDIGAVSLAIPLLISLIIVLISVTFQVFKEARRNPIESIRAK